jgi:hypothetical protein
MDYLGCGVGRSLPVSTMWGAPQRGCVEIGQILLERLDGFFDNSDIYNGSRLLFDERSRPESMGDHAVIDGPA